MLVIALGFQLPLDSFRPSGFDLERSPLTDLLAATLRDRKDEIPGLREMVALDVTYLDAWVKENYLREYVPDRSDTTRVPEGKRAMQRCFSRASGRRAYH